MSHTLGRTLVASVAAIAIPIAVPAQQQAITITGTVTGPSGAPLPAVQVFVPSLNVGGQTRDDGRYTFTVPRAAPGTAVTVTARGIGYKLASVSVTLAAGTTTQNFVLESTPLQLSGVVVTALGIEQQRAEVATSVQTVSGADIAAIKTPNLVAALAGKVSGVQINSATTQGGSSRIVIRGPNSISGNNQPLFVIDGVPVTNQSVGSPVGYGGKDYGNAIQDVSPNDIESVNILKGPNAAALYGSRASNGAIVITTKSGRGTRGTTITASQSTQFDTPVVPAYQNAYGQGAGGEYQYVDGMGGGVNDDVDESWGPKLDGRLVDQWFGKAQPWVAHPDNVKSFFDVGRTYNSDVSVTAGTERASARLSATSQQLQGITPNNALRKIGATFAGTVQANDRLSFTAAGSYIQNGGRNRPGTGYGTDNIMEQFGWFARQTDMSLLRTYKSESGQQLNWISRYHNNPYWIQYQNGNDDARDRLFGHGAATYKLTDWLSVTGQSGTDWYRENRDVRYAAGTIGFASATVDPNWNGGFNTLTIFQQETNSNFLVNARHGFFGERVSVNANVGGNTRFARYRADRQVTNALVVPGLYNIANSAVAPTASNLVQNKRVNSVYGSTQLGYKGWAFVELTGRQDYSSTLPQGNNVYFYPSVSGSFVFTDAVPALRGRFLSSGKLRASWAKVGSDADPYQLVTTVGPLSSKLNGQAQFTVSDTLANRNLRPETIASTEGGVELGFFDDRLGLDATYYSTASTDQILSAQISAASGFGSAAINAGKMTNRGLELRLTATPVRLRNGFEWTTALNYAKNRNRVVALVPGLDSYQIGSYWNAYVLAKVGQPYGTIVGYGYLRDAAGNVVVNGNGLPLRDDVQKVLGSYMPDWTGGFSNTFRYKRVTANALIDVRRGGKLLSIGNMFNDGTGVYEETVKGREEADYFVVPGVVCAASDTKREHCTPNTTKVSAEAYWHSFSNQYLHEPFTYDASFVKLRELRLGYDVAPSLLRRAKLSSANVSLIGRNLFSHDDVPHIDAETGFQAGNLQGIEYGQLPPTRSIGFSLTVTP